jgi:hypothetical protein
VLLPLMITLSPPNLLRPALPMTASSVRNRDDAAGDHAPTKPPRFSQNLALEQPERMAAGRK